MRVARDTSIGEMTSRTPVPTPLASGAATSRGHRRATNEDAHLAGPIWFVVADGMGGHHDGEVASALAIDVFANASAAGVRSPDDAVTLVEAAHEAIRAGGNRARSDTGSSGMGTTVVGATVVVHGDATRLAVFHVGDSRCYRLFDGRLVQVTRDHSHVQELIDAGHLTHRTAARHPLRNVLTRALGVELGRGADIALLDLRPGRLLLCSDGVWGELDDGVIGRVLGGIPDPQEAADRLIELVLSGPARDDATAVVVDVGAGPMWPVGLPARETVR